MDQPPKSSNPWIIQTGIVPSTYFWRNMSCHSSGECDFGRVESVETRTFMNNISIHIWREINSVVPLINGLSQIAILSLAYFHYCHWIVVFVDQLSLLFCLLLFNTW